MATWLWIIGSGCCTLILIQFLTCVLLYVDRGNWRRRYWRERDEFRTHLEKSQQRWRDILDKD
jgi:hypothetical protein